MITQLQLDDRIRFNTRHVKKWSRSQKLRLQRTAKAYIRKSKSRALAWYRTQYFLSSAMRDARIAIARNEDIFVAVSAISLMVGYGFAVLVSQILYLFFITTYTIGEISGINMLLLSVCAASYIGALVGWVGAFIMNMQSMAIFQGANRVSNKSARRLIRNSLRLATRTSMVWLAVLIRVAIPLAISGIITMVAVKTGLASLENTPILIMLSMVMLTGLIVSVRRLINATLTPYIMLFEPKTDFDLALARSEKLVSRRGKLFLLSGYSLLVLVLGAVYGTAWAVDQLIGLHVSIIFSLGTILVLLTANGVLVSFYRKRRLARNR